MLKDVFEVVQEKVSRKTTEKIAIQIVAIVVVAVVW